MSALISPRRTHSSFLTLQAIWSRTALGILADLGALAPHVDEACVFLQAIRTSGASALLFLSADHFLFHSSLSEGGHCHPHLGLITMSSSRQTELPSATVQATPASADWSHPSQALQPWKNSVPRDLPKRVFAHLSQSKPEHPIAEVDQLELNADSL
ncbi:unnamed protein product [Symbiodinium sp. CCMP2592]|nr:unnamed protein product [Symbiodinium sp. CCMP2592]